MSTFKILTMITGRKIKVRENIYKRYYTIVTDSGKYRTFPMNKDEFNSASYWTGQDWQTFLNSNDYFSVK